MKQNICATGLIAFLAIGAPLCSQTVASTSGWEQSHPKGLAEGGPAHLMGSMFWKDDGSYANGGFRWIDTPGERDWDEDYDDAPKALARMRRIESSNSSKDFELEYVTLSGQTLRVGCRKVGSKNNGINWAALHVFLDHYEPGRGYRIFRNGILIHQEFFDPQPLPPRLEVKELGTNQVEWLVHRSPKLECYQVRVSWDKGKSWAAGRFTENHVILNLEESRRKPGIQPWIEFQIAQGFVVTAKRYVIGKGFAPGS